MYCQNSGDLPAYVNRLIIEVGNDKLDTTLAGLYLPGKGVDGDWGYSFTKDADSEKMLSVDSAGDYTVTVDIYDNDNKLADTYEEAITIEDKSPLPPPEDDKSDNEANTNNDQQTDSTPGFEIFLTIIAIALLLTWKRHRKK